MRKVIRVRIGARVFDETGYGPGTIVSRAEIAKARRDKGWDSVTRTPVYIKFDENLLSDTRYYGGDIWGLRLRHFTNEDWMKYGRAPERRRKK